MKKFAMTMGVAVLAALVSLPAVAGYTPKATRVVQVLNKSWTFIKDDVSGAQAPAFDDAAWTKTQLPHSFEMPYWRSNVAKAPTVGWYRKHLTVEPSWIRDHKRINVEFEAAFLVAQVYVNGELVGTHKGGYTGFSYDITDKVKAGDNVIAVRLDASWNPRVTPRAGEHIFAGGIYRDVYLVVTDPLHVPWCGTFVTTPKATAAEATVRVQTEIRNDSAVAKSCCVKSVVVDAAGKIVASFASTSSVPAGATVAFDQTSPTIANPRLWSPDPTSATPPPKPLDLTRRPDLYTVHSEVYEGGKLVDHYTSPLGIRSIEWNTKQGFVLNGAKCWLKGANVHQDHAGWGDATCNSGSFRDVKLLHDAGFNFIRGSHYPHDPAFADACDELGMTLWCELPFWGIGGFNANKQNIWAPSAYPPDPADQPEFEANVIAQLKEMIRIHRNHPSIVIWSLGNEFGYSDGALMPKVKALVERMKDVVHAEDPTRPCGQGIGFGNWPQMNTSTEVIGLNGGNNNAKFTVNSPVVSMESEYGSGTSTRGRGGDNFNGCFDGAKINTEPPTDQIVNNAPVQFSWRPGVSIWCAYDHGSNYGMGHMGFTDHARVPKKRYYFYRELYAGIPHPAWPTAGVPARIALTADRTTITDDGRSDARIAVQIQDAKGNWLTNSPAVTLTDTTGRGLFPTGASISFTPGATEKGITEGLAAIEYRCYVPGEVTIEAKAEGLPPARLKLKVEHAEE